MFKKFKLLLAITVLTALIFSCEKANVTLPESQDNNITSTSNRARMGPSIEADLEAICTGLIFGGEQPGTIQGVGIGYDYNTIKVTLDYQTSTFYPAPFNYKIYNSSGLLVKNITLYPKPVVFLSGLGNNSDYQVVITASGGVVWNAFNVTTLDCNPIE